MPIDFQLLSMTELRNRPGEILDRVADHGENFIIECNSRRKACLVPISVFLPDISPARIATELEELTTQGLEPSASFTSDREMILRFSKVLEDRTPVCVEVLLPHGYPNNCPKVYVKQVRDDAPHRWADGALCLFGVMASWNPGKHTILSTLKLADRWLERYQGWLETGKWSDAGE